MRLITFAGSRRSGRSIGLPSCFFLSRSFRASSYRSSNLPGSKCAAFVSTICEARSSISLGNLIGNVVEIVSFVANFVWIPQRDAEQSLPARLQCNDVLTGREDDLANCDHALFADGFPDHGERLLADLSIWCDVIGAVQVEFVYLLLGHELVDVDHALALDCHGFEFLGTKFDVLALTDLIALDDIGGLDLVPALGIDLAILYSMASVLVDLMEADFLPLRGCRKQSNRT